MRDILAHAGFFIAAGARDEHFGQRAATRFLPYGERPREEVGEEPDEPRLAGHAQ